MRKSHQKTLKFFSQLIDFDATVQLFVLVLMFIISKDPCTAQLICPIICLHVELSVGQHYTLHVFSVIQGYHLSISSSTEIQCTETDIPVALLYLLKMSI